MSELDEMKEKLEDELRLLARTYHCYRGAYASVVDEQTAIREAVDFSITNILSLSTDTCRIAVVRKEAQLPSVTWTVSSDVPVGTELEIGSAFLKTYKDAGYVQEVTDA